MDEAPPRRIQGIDLKVGKESDVVGGSIVALHQYLSPSFLAYYCIDHDASCAYMSDVRSTHKKDRKIRVSSMDHVNTKPTWLQFGDKTDVYLYLSQKASVAEETWLSIVNHVMTLLVEQVNLAIKNAQPDKVPASKLLRHRNYRVTVGSISDPNEGNYGPHDDGKPGTVLAGDPNFSLFQLMVPTLCIQNYCYSNTTITWRPKQEPQYVAGEVQQEFVLFHLQMLGVQDNFKHEVSFSSVVCLL